MRVKAEPLPYPGILWIKARFSFRGPLATKGDLAAKFCWIMAAIQVESSPGEAPAVLIQI